MDRNTYLDLVLDKYSACYDVSRTPEGVKEAAAAAEYHEHGVGYALVRKAEMWSADRHEYVWFYSMPCLTEQKYDECYAEAFKAGMDRVVPKEGHMSTAVAAVFVCDTAEPSALRKLERCRYRKDFKFGLQGWVSVHTACVVLNEDKVVVNPEGRNERKFLDSILHPRKRRKRTGLLAKLFSHSIV